MSIFFNCMEIKKTVFFSFLYPCLKFYISIQRSVLGSCVKIKLLSAILVVTLTNSFVWPKPCTIYNLCVG